LTHEGRSVALIPSRAKRLRNRPHKPAR
jgi:hypothetical protein